MQTDPGDSFVLSPSAHLRTGSSKDRLAWEAVGLVSDLRQPQFRDSASSPSIGNDSIYPEWFEGQRLWFDTLTMSGICRQPFDIRKTLRVSQDEPASPGS